MTTLNPAQAIIELRLPLNNYHLSTTTWSNMTQKAVYNDHFSQKVKTSLGPLKLTCAGGLNIPYKYGYRHWCTLVVNYIYSIDIMSVLDIIFQQITNKPLLTLLNLFIIPYLTLPGATFPESLTRVYQGVHFFHLMPDNFLQK